MSRGCYGGLTVRGTRAENRIETSLLSWCWKGCVTILPSLTVIHVCGSEYRDFGLILCIDFDFHARQFSPLYLPLKAFFFIKIRYTVSFLNQAQCLSRFWTIWHTIFMRAHCVPGARERVLIISSCRCPLSSASERRSADSVPYRTVLLLYTVRNYSSSPASNNDNRSHGQNRSR